MARSTQCFATGVVALSLCGCLGEQVANRTLPSSGIPNPSVTLANSSFEQEATAWHFYFNESDGKVVKGEGVMDSSCAKLVVGPKQQLDGFSQWIAPLDSQTMKFTGAVAAEGSDFRAYLYIECLNPLRAETNGSSCQRPSWTASRPPCFNTPQQLRPQWYSPLFRDTL